MVLGGLAVAALTSVGIGVWRLWAPPPRPAPVQAGAGVWDAAPPTDVKPGDTTAVCPGCDIVLVTMCSLRRDHVGVYGVGPDLTPAFDTLAQGGFRMDQAWSASNFTLAALTAVLTGRFGSTTGVTGWDKGLVKDIPTLPEILGYYGYSTGGFTIDAPSGFRPDYGLDRGFSRLEIIPAPRDTPDGRTRGGAPGPGGDSARPAAAWITAQAPDRPIFVMLHSRSAHFPFVVDDDPTDPTGVSQLLWDSGNNVAPTQAMPGTAGGTAQRGVVLIPGQDPVQEGVRKAGAAGVAVWKQRYAEAVARMDKDLAVLHDALVARGRLDHTIVVLLADHGESLDDHGELLHGDAYYDGVVHIPMVIRVPGLEGRPIAALTSQVDILPTLLELVGATRPAGIDGVSMLPLFRGTSERTRVATLVEGGVSWHQDDAVRGAVISPPWALLRQDRGCDGGDPPRKPGQPGTCLYNLDEDPGQVHNVVLAHPDVVTDLQGRWDQFRAARGEATQLTLDPAFVAELRRNGYNFDPEPAP